MKYIVLDLEWDSAFCPYIGRFINQILQIGAVKLNEDFDIEDTFDVKIKSSFSKRVSKRFRELTGITKEEMLSGVSLERAFRAYNDWVGDNAVTMTWSNSDIYTVIENEKNLLSGVKLRIDKYLDLQKYIQGEMRIAGIECNSQISLLNAAAALGIDVDESTLHNAKADSIVCAKLLKKHYNKERFTAMVCDASKPDFFARFTFKPYYISDIDDADIDKSLLQFKCDKCGAILEIKRDWRYHSGGFFAEMVCKNCDRKFSARARFRKTFDDVKVRRRLVEKKTEGNEKNDM